MAPAPPTKEKILSLFFSKPRRRFIPTETLKGIAIPRGELQAVIESLRQLCREGKLVRLRKNHYALPDGFPYFCSLIPFVLWQVHLKSQRLTLRNR